MFFPVASDDFFLAYIKSRQCLLLSSRSWGTRYFTGSLTDCGVSLLNQMKLFQILQLTKTVSPFALPRFPPVKLLTRWDSSLPLGMKEGRKVSFSHDQCCLCWLLAFVLWKVVSNKLTCRQLNIIFNVFFCQIMYGGVHVLLS